MKTLAFSAREHQTHRESLLRFLALVLILAGYFGAMSWKHDAATGAWLAVVSWSFFVLCTPIADGGFIVAFPVRLLFGVKMFITQIVVWVLALAVNIVGLSASPESYSQTTLTELLDRIISTPWPYWGILALSLAGTMLSIWFSDEMIDVASHAERVRHHKHGFTHKTIIIVGVGVLTVALCYVLLNSLDTELPRAG